MNSMLDFLGIPRQDKLLFIAFIVGVICLILTFILPVFFEISLFWVLLFWVFSILLAFYVRYGKNGEIRRRLDWEKRQIKKTVLLKQ